jgi:hypothetical protein
VNILRPSGLHRHCPRTALVKVAVDVAMYHGQWPSDPALCLPRSGEGM